MSDQRHPFAQKLIHYGTIALTVLALVLLGSWRSPVLASPARHYTELTFPPLPEIELPDYTRYEMDNGIVVYLMEDHELPLVGGSATFRTGDRFEPAEKTGLASIMGEVMRSGGTVNHPPDRLNQILEQRAASVETGVDISSGSASFSALSEDLAEVFGLFAEVIRQPAFPQDKIELSKTQFRGSISRRNDDPDEIVGREFQKLIYGTESPYARTVEYTTLDNISRDDLVQFYQTYFQPSTMILGIVGDFDTETMRSLIEEQFGDWQPAPSAADLTLPAVNQANQGGVFLVDQPQLTQSFIQMGHLGGQLNSPGYVPLSVLNEVMNGFGGRLVNEVRSRQGLAYVVYAYWSARFDYPGVFIGGGQTRSEATVSFIQSVLAEIEKIRTSPISDIELARAKDAVLNAFIFNFQTPAQVLSRLIRYEYFGYPSDFIFRYRREIENTTTADILEAAQTYLQPDQIVTLVVGNSAAINPPLSSLAPGVEVIPVDITIPEAVTSRQ
ncbi:insulinase family protein [Oscillatoria sp. FACHB-1407]|uniref:M16 family metallopeptidase n=1 Tax=Oscillatoria sp. FACHB-1407 TaxID=2692847 RepID=UPI001685BB8D|nr:pitrilysin family protein [Oscillatoria sp. FACHB-1407]MBD2461170.1 insulinase family protein [Oscillatoria sp. FACHB-1407]